MNHENLDRYQLPMKPIPERVERAISVGVRSAPDVAFAGAGRLLQGDGLQDGVVRNRDGILVVACLTEMPNVTPAMWDWWFGWHLPSSERYRLWHPKAHVKATVPRLVTFNGSGFDLPVLRYRAMMHSIPAPGLRKRAYFNRYSEDAIDLCDVLASYGSSAKVKLDALAKAFGLPGKPEGMDGSEVEAYVRDGRIREVADYCETDVVTTYRIWLRHELFKGAIDAAGLASSEQQLREFVQRRRTDNPQLIV